jgi:glutathione S-transferase
MLTLYGSPFSPRVNKLRYIANHIGLDYEHVPLSPLKGETRSPEYLRIHPAGKIPAMVDDDFALFESMAIARYLASKARSPIYPEELRARAIVDQWCEFVTHHVEAGMVKVFFNRVMVPLFRLPVEVDTRAEQEGLAWLDRYLPIIEGQLAEHAHVAGEAISLADFALLAALDPAEPAEVDLAAWPSLEAWRARMRAEPFHSACHERYADIVEAFRKD